MYELKKIDPTSLARVVSFISAVLYLLFALVTIFTGGTDFTPVNGVATVVIGIVLAAVVGMILGVIIGGLYNLMARAWGGLHLDFHLVMDEEAEHSAHEDSRKNQAV